MTSREPIRATFSNGLTVGVIPMRLVVRLDVAPSTCAFVVHGGSTPQDVRGPVESHTFRETGA